MADQRLPEFVAVVTPARTDEFPTRQSGDTRDKRETIAQALSLIADGDIAESNVTQHVGALEHSSLLNVPTTIDQAEAEAGTATTDRLFTAERVAQAIAALATAGVDTSGTPANNQIAVFTDVDTIEGDAKLTWDGGTLDFTTLAPSEVVIQMGGTGSASTTWDIWRSIDNGGSAFWRLEDDHALSAANHKLELRHSSVVTPFIQYDASGELGIGGEHGSTAPLVVTGIGGTEKLIVMNGATLYMAELAAATADLAGQGQFWIRNDAPNTPMFTDDTGVDHVLSLPDPLLLSDGLETAPTYSFASDPDSGLYSVSANSLGFTIGGSVRFLVSTPFLAGVTTTAGGIVDEAVTVTNPTVIISRSDLDTGLGGTTDLLSLIAGGVQIAQAKEVVGANQFILTPGLIDNTPATPTLAFGDGDSGWYESADDTLRLSLGGIDQWAFQLLNIISLAGSGPKLAGEAATVTNPTLIPNQGSDSTGLGGDGIAASLISSGVEILRARNGGTAATRQVTIGPAGVIGAAATPSLAWGDGDTGFRESVDDTLVVTTLGLDRFKWAANVFGANQGAGPAMLNEDASATNPTLVPNQADDDTGLGRDTVDGLAFIAGGVSCMRIREIAAAPAVGFYTTTPIVKQTGVAVTEAGIHAALVNLGLIAA